MYRPADREVFFGETSEQPVERTAVGCPRVYRRGSFGGHEKLQTSEVRRVWGLAELAGTRRRQAQLSSDTCTESRRIAGDPIVYNQTVGEAPIRDETP
jgi:hypothetical protein